MKLETILKKWRNYCYSRDEATCQMCAALFRSDFARLQVHHIRPKSLYPHLALRIDNGITLCTGCHIAVVHAGNTFADIASVGNWASFVPMFDRKVNLAYAKRFEAKWQPRLDALTEGIAL